MTKASDNAFPSVLVTEGTVPATPAAGKQRLYIDSTTHLLKYVNSSGTASNVDTTGGGSSDLLAVSTYASGSDAAVGTTSSTSFVDLDATNAAVTFTAPASGNVLVRLTGIQSGTAPNNAFWGLRESSSNIGTPVGLLVQNGAGVLQSAAIYLTGISAGSHTYKWSHRVSASTGGVYAGPNYGKIVMEVWAAP
jgi:hypothetical protein